MQSLLTSLRKTDEVKPERPVEIYDLWQNVFFRNVLLTAVFLYLISHISWFVLLSAFAIVAVRVVDRETIQNLKLNELFSLFYTFALCARREKKKE